MTVADVSGELAVLAIWEDGGGTDAGLCYRDPRLLELGTRCILPIPQRQSRKPQPSSAPSWSPPTIMRAHRIALGVPRGGTDFIYGDAFPHETDMDQLHGVDFKKGCFVGQEVVSRIEHRGTARIRVIPLPSRARPRKQALR